MSLFFLLNNLHFALAVFGVLVFSAVAWLAFDAFLVRRDFATISRGIGFFFLAMWQLLHALSLAASFWDYAIYTFYFLGLTLVIWNLAIESFTERPRLRAVVLLPSLASFSVILNAVGSAGLFLVALLSARQYRRESKKSLLPFAVGFSLLSLGAFLSIFYSNDSFDILWNSAHILEFAGFLALGFWVWQFLQLRIREELMLVFFVMALLITIVVTLAFSNILVSRIEAETRVNLASNTRVIDFAMERLGEEAAAKVAFLERDPQFSRAVVDNDFVTLESLAALSLTQTKLGFLTVVDANGDVLARGHGLTRKGDNILSERAVEEALRGQAFSTIEVGDAEQFSIRAASPLVQENEVIGAIVGGFQLDNAFVDSMKKITGLPMSIFENDLRVASTTFKPDGKTRLSGIREVEKKVLDTVLLEGNPYTLRTQVLSQLFLASYFPIRDADNKIVGMISSEKPQQEIVDIINRTNRLTFASIIIIMLALVVPAYVLTRRLAREVT